MSDLFIIAAGLVASGVVCWVVLRPRPRDDAWARSPERQRGVARWVDARPWAVGGEAWHHDAGVTITHIYPQRRLARVKDGLGIEYPVMLSDLRRQRPRRAA